MTNQQKLEEYKKILQKDEPLDTFNWGAFIFNSFYYLWKDISIWKFFIYFLATPFLIFLFSQTQINPYFSIFMSVFSVRIVAGFRANHDLKIHMQKFVDYYQKNGTDIQPTVYFSISLTRLFFLSIFTFGIYDIYWAYKNWVCVKKYEKDNSIVPFFRSWVFGVLFIYPLFLRMKTSFSKANCINKFFTLYAVLYTVLYLIDIYITTHADPNNILMEYLSYVILFVTTLLLLPIQKNINKYNKTLDSESKPLTKFLPGEIIVIALSWLILVIGIYAGYTSEKNNLEQKQFVTYIYINEKVYPEMCKKYGYELKRYQQVFRKLSAEKIKEIKNIDIQKELQELDNAYGKDAIQSLEKIIIGNNNSTAEYNQAIIKQTCMEIDTNAEEFITNQLKDILQ